VSDSLGIYVSVPFCKAKCSFCNFASGVFADGRIDGYVARLIEEMKGARAWAESFGVEVPERLDSVYFGGGTPSLLEPEVIRRVFAGIRGEFAVDTVAEITVECAPGQMSDAGLAAWQAEGVNRLSFGVQSFVDRECASVGRLHTGAECRDELRRMQRAGVERLGIDLIVGLPHQTEASWRYSVDQAVESGVEHVSVYMLEVDEGSRLGREALAGGERYGAGDLPDEDRVADWYEAGCEWLSAAGVRQYEISNFAREGGESRHNLKYWERKSYLGFGLDAHSMLRGPATHSSPAAMNGARFCAEAVRWANPDEMDAYVGLMGTRGFARTVDLVAKEAAFEEALFLGLRLVEGVDLTVLDASFGMNGLIAEPVAEMAEAGLVEVSGGRLRLTGRGQMASNEVFERLLVGAGVLG
jgi:oxygen-independent coproporphyrinogen-3 oxidase